MVEALLICKRRFKVGCITNNVELGLGPGMAASPAGASRASDIMQHFDAVIESSKAGVRKPDPRIYLMMCERLGVETKAASTSMTWGSTASRRPSSAWSRSKW